MSINSYADLQTAVQNWLVRPDLAPNVADFITLAEAYIVNPPDQPLRVRQMEARSDATAAPVTSGGNGQYLSLPSDFLELRSLSVLTPIPSMPLILKTPDYIKRRYWLANTSGIPECYAIVGPEIMLGPGPDVPYQLEIDYYAFAPLSVAAPVNWLLTQFPNAYLFGALSEAAPFMRADARVAVWEAKRDAAISGIRTADTRARWPLGAMAASPDGPTP